MQSCINNTEQGADLLEHWLQAMEHEIANLINELAWRMQRRVNNRERWTPFLEHSARGRSGPTFHSCPSCVCPGTKGGHTHTRIEQQQTMHRVRWRAITMDTATISRDRAAIIGAIGDVHQTIGRYQTDNKKQGAVHTLTRTDKAHSYAHVCVYLYTYCKYIGSV